MEQKEFFEKVERFATHFNNCIFSYLEDDKKTFDLDSLIQAKVKLESEGDDICKECKELGIKWDPFVLIPDGDEGTIHIRMNMFSFLTILAQIKESIDYAIGEYEDSAPTEYIPIESEYLKNFYDPDSRDLLTFMEELGDIEDACIIPWIMSCAYEKETTTYYKAYKRKRWSLTIGEDYDRTSFISMLANIHLEFAVGGVSTTN